MTQRLFALFSVLAVFSAAAKDGDFIQTGWVSVSEQTDPFPGISAISRSTTTNLFDEHGNVAQTINLSYFNGDGIPNWAFTNYFYYDRRGNLVSSVQEFDSNGDGIPDEIITNHLFLDRRGNLVSLVQEIDSNGDGIPDEIITDHLFRDQRGVLLSAVEDDDVGADGTIDQIVTNTFTYDSEGREIGSVSLYDTNADGVADFQSVTSLTYDRQGHLLLFTNEDDFYSPGTLELRTTVSFTLNSDGSPVSSIVRNYDTIIGSQVTWFATYTYDKFGNLVQQTEEAQLPGPNGPNTYTTTFTFFYSRRGPVIRGVRSPPDLPAARGRLRLEGRNFNFGPVDSR